MRTSRKRSTKASEEPSNQKLGPGWPQVCKTTKRTRVQCPMPAGSGKVLNTILLDEGKDYVEKKKGIPVSEQCVERMHQPSAKIKLQLFPIDERTCVGLERDGYHPYLELTLSAWKKISSVLKRLNNKWGGSSIATGEPVLFPYNPSEGLTSCRWTLNDTDINAGDVYTAIGRPSVFRLRYGWLSGSGIKSFEEPAQSISSETCLQNEVKQNGTSAITDGIHGVLTKNDATSEHLEPTFADGARDAMSNKKTSNGFVEPTVNEVRADVGVGQSSTLWDDNLTNISIGGLLSEASLQGMFNNCDPKPSGSSTGMQPSQLIIDSFDAFIAAQGNTSQVLSPATHGSVTSILDAEDTCHAFSFKKISCSDKNAAAFDETVSQGFDQVAGSKLVNYPQAAKVNAQSGSPEGHNFQDSEIDVPLHSQVYNDESSLGLSGIKWSDSLGPFDLGLSSSRRIISGDSISLSKILSKQTDS